MISRYCCSEMLKRQWYASTEWRHKSTRLNVPASVMMDGSLQEDGKTIASYEYNIDVTKHVAQIATHRERKFLLESEKNIRNVAQLRAFKQVGKKITHAEKKRRMTLFPCSVSNAFYSTCCCILLAI